MRRKRIATSLDPLYGQFGGRGEESVHLAGGSLLALSDPANSGVLVRIPAPALGQDGRAVHSTLTPP